MGDCAEMLLDGTLDWDGSYDPYKEDNHTEGADFGHVLRIRAYNRDEVAINKFLYEKLSINDYKERGRLIKAYVCHRFSKKASKNPRSKFRQILKKLR
jgi:hypothetical protein